MPGSRTPAAGASTSCTAASAAASACARRSRSASRTRCWASRSTTRSTTTSWGSTTATCRPCGTFAAGQEIVFRFEFDNFLVPGRYAISPAIAHDGGGVHWLDYRKRWISFVDDGHQRDDRRARRDPVPAVPARRRRHRPTRQQHVSTPQEVMPPGTRVQGPDRPRQRSPPAPAAGLDARGDGLQAALLRLGPGLPVAAHATADAVRDPLRRSSRRSWTSPVPRSTSGCRCCSGSCSTTSSARRPAGPSRAS